MCRKYSSPGLDKHLEYYVFLNRFGAYALTPGWGLLGSNTRGENYVDAEHP